MQKENQESFGPYLLPEMRLGIGLPLSGGGLFKDTAVITKAGNAALLIGLAGGEPPEGVCSEVGSILSASVTVDDKLYNCGAIVTEKHEAGALKIQLFGLFSPGGATEVLRLNGEMKVRYAAPKEMDAKEIENEWDRRRHLEHIQFQALSDLALAAERARVRPPRELDWHDLKRGSVSLGVYGIGIRMTERMQPGQLLFLDLHLPMNVPRQVWAVAEVLAVKAPEQVGRRSYHECWMQFVHLHERDRELILQHISVAQRGQLRENAVQDEADEHDPIDLPATKKRRGVVLPVLSALLLAALVLILINIFTRSGPSQSGEIQRTYEKAIRQYRHQGE